MKITRHSCFETNSSSAHTISIEDGVDYDTIVDWRDTGFYVVELEGCEFGWEIEDYTNPHTKLAYLITDVNYCNEELKERLHRLIAEVFIEHTGLNLVIEDPVREDGYSFSNYIDHQSIGTAIEAIREDGNSDEQIKANIKNFVFNRKSVLHTDNDNH